MASVIRVAFCALAAIATVAVASCSDREGAVPISGQDASLPPPSNKWDCADTRPVPTFSDLQKGILRVCIQCHSAKLVRPVEDAGDPRDAASARDGGDASVAREAGTAFVVDAGDAGDPRHGAPPGVNFDTYEDFLLFADTASFLVKQHAMPYPDGEGVTEEERRELYAWVECGTPE
jgi:uncharacterized membrane protein